MSIYLGNKKVGISPPPKNIKTPYERPSDWLEMPKLLDDTTDNICILAGINRLDSPIKFTLDCQGGRYD